MIEAPADAAPAHALARTLGIPCIPAADRATAARYRFLLAWNDHRLEIRHGGHPGAPTRVSVDLVGGTAARRWRQEPLSRRLPLARAVGIGRGTRTVLDANAGLGRDAFLLACCGCDVHAIERSPIVAALLQDGLDRALADPTTRQLLARRGGALRLQQAEALEVLRALDPAQPAPDAIYLDPMLPRSGKSALVKKEMRLLQDLLGPDADAAELLAAARATARLRTVVKRPRRAPALAPPDASIRSTRARWDIYLATTG